MGEAKRRREQQRNSLIKEMEYMMSPPFENETTLWEEVMALPAVEIPRAPTDVMEWMRMVQNACHQNCEAYARLDPSKRARVVVGWLCDSTIPRLHSVVDAQGDGQLLCITPMGNLDSSVFRPDPLVEWTPGNEGHWRTGRKLPVLLRPDPLRTYAAAAEVRQLVLAGANVLSLPTPLLMDIGIPQRMVEERA